MNLKKKRNHWYSQIKITIFVLVGNNVFVWYSYYDDNFAILWYKIINYRVVDVKIIKWFKMFIGVTFKLTLVNQHKI